MLLTNQISTVAFSAALYCLPLTLLGCWAGLRLFSQTSEHRFRNTVLGLLLISGTTLVLQSVLAIV